MILDELLKNVEFEQIKNFKPLVIEKIAFKKDEKCDMFLSLKDDEESSFQECLLAVQNGAKVVVSQFKHSLDVAQLKVKNIRESMSIIAGNFYGNPANDLKILGVTGTNGKTTSTYIVKSILETAGYKVGLIGTNCNIIDKEVINSNLTTPDPLELHQLLLEMKQAKCDYVVMEVSAHALYFKKVEGLNFECGIFTNLSQDHLDFFKDMQSYAQTKSSLFQKKYVKNAIFNVDDDFGHLFARYCNCPRVISYGLNNPSDVFAVNLDVKLNGSDFFINAMDDIANLHFNIGGKHNVYNVLGAVACCKALGIDFQTIVKGVESLQAVEGRFNILESAKGYKVIIDYAHTPDGLENILKTVRQLTDKKVISVFGCGGNRDSTKRPIMGQISGELSDFTILTSDNPRFEDSEDIMNQIETGLFAMTDNYIKIENRKSAIEYAMKIANYGDVIVISGKGQENYQEINGERKYFSDKEVVKSFLDAEKSREELQLQV